MNAVVNFVLLSYT